MRVVFSCCAILLVDNGEQAEHKKAAGSGKHYGYGSSSLNYECRRPGYLVSTYMAKRFNHQYLPPAAGRAGPLRKRRHTLTLSCAASYF